MQSRGGPHKDGIGQNDQGVQVLGQGILYSRPAAFFQQHLAGGKNKYRHQINAGIEQGGVIHLSPFGLLYVGLANSTTLGWLRGRPHQAQGADLLPEKSTPHTMPQTTVTARLAKATVRGSRRITCCEPMAYTPPSRPIEEKKAKTHKGAPAAVLPHTSVGDRQQQVQAR